jgi:chemotaxis protein MotB
MAKSSLFPRKNLPNFTRPLREPLSENSGLLVTLSDLTLLLLCAVVIWHVVDKQAALRQYTLGASAATTPASALPAPPSGAAIEFLPIAPTFQQEDTVLAASPVPIVDDNLNRWELLKKEIETSVAGSGLDDRVLIASTRNELSIALKETVLFSRGKADLNAGIFPILEKVAALALNHPDLALEVLGHTDDVPIATAEFPSNWELSTARATRVARGLVGAGVAPTRISVQGYASFHPLIANTSDENRATNRRVEIRLYRTIKDENDANPSP